MNPKDYQNRAAGNVVYLPSGYWAFIPNPLPPDIRWTSSLVSALADAEREYTRLSTSAITFPYPHLFVQPFIRGEAVISSRIEGTRASIIDIYTYEINQLSFLEQANDTREVHNYVRALDYGIERVKTLPVSLRLFREIHKILMEGVRGEMMTPGEFRRSQNWIGPPGSTLTEAPYVPPPVEEMHNTLNSLEKFIHSDLDIPQLVKAGLFHYQFEAIHPFLDGNGRIGRLLISLLLCEWQLQPYPLLNLSIYFERYRQEYYDHLLSVSRAGTWENWLCFFLRGISLQARDAAKRMESLGAIRTKYQPIIDHERNPERMAAVVDFLFSRPVFSIRQIAIELTLPYKTAYDYVEKLIRARIIRETTGFSRNRIFQADEILNEYYGDRM